MNIAILLAYRAAPDSAKVGVFPQLRSLKVKPDYIAILLRLCSKSSLDIFMQKVKFSTSFILTIAFTSQNGCFNHKVITLEEKVVVRD